MTRRRRAPEPTPARQRLPRRLAALICWVFGTWVLLTWTFSWSQLLFGVGFALAIALALAPLGEVAEPWAPLRPRRALGLSLLVVECLGRIVRANLSLAYRIWRPRRPLRSGMVVVPTEMRSEGGLCAVGILTSLIVDNQIVDLDVHRHELQYHAVWVTEGGADEHRSHVNGPIERRLQASGVR